MRRGVRGAVRCVAVFALAAGAVACGGSDDDAAGTETESVAAAELSDAFADREALEEVGAETEQFVEAVTTALGDRGAFDALLYATTRGYSVEQIDVAVFDDRLQADGTIMSGGGALEAPVYEATGVVELPGPSGFGRSGPQGTAQVEMLWETMRSNIGRREADIRTRTYHPDEEMAKLIVGITITLLKAGYSDGQIVEAIVLDSGFGVTPVWADCVWLLDERTGAPIRPALEVEHKCSVNLHGAIDTWEASQSATTGDASDDTAELTPDTGAATHGDAADSYRLTVVLDLSDDGGFIRYDWNGEFRLDEDGTVAGTGTVSGSSAGTCSSPGFDGTVEGPYAYSVVGAFDIVGQESGDQLEISMANPTASFTSEDGDRSILCVEITADLALDFGRIPLGAAELELGSIVVPAAGGSATLDAGEGLVFAIDVSPV